MIEFNEKVLNYINFPVAINSYEKKAFEHLRRYIDEWDNQTLEAFLQFSSGSSIIIPGINIHATNFKDLRKNANSTT